jgi:[acyl-carrier-protein] S-malonyltransferase
MVAGHSLGEFSALAAAGAMDFEDALKLVAVRASAMQKCCEQVPGTMAAIIKLPTETIEEICTSCTGIVVPANYNCDGQVVISGEAEAVAEACTKMKEAGAKRALPLAVSGAFHSPLMEPARLELADAIDKTPFRIPACPVYQNVTALPATDPAVIKENLLRQLTSPVRWTQTVQNMVADGADHFLEIGPGTVLQGLVGRIAPEAVKEGLSE